MARTDLNEDVRRLCERREALQSLQPSCPSCRDVQVQLVEYIFTVPAIWKCRICHQRFEKDLVTETQ